MASRPQTIRQDPSDPGFPRAIQAGSRVEQRDSHRLAFVLYRSNTSAEVVVRFDGFSYNSLVPADRFVVLPDEAFRP